MARTPSTKSQPPAASRHPQKRPYPILQETLADKQYATTLARGLEVLRCFSPEEPLLGNKDLALKTGLPRPTISRFTYTLVRLGYLRSNASTNKYQLGSAVVSLGYPLLARMPMRQIARQGMNELADHVGGSVSMGIRDRLNMVYIETSRSRANFAPQFSDMGWTHPIVATSMGRAYLAACAPHERVAILNEIKVKTPEYWKQYRDAVSDSQKDFARLGFCVSIDLFQPNVYAVGAPLRRQLDGEIVVFNCVVNAARMTRERLENDIGPRLVAMIRTFELSPKLL